MKNFVEAKTVKSWISDDEEIAFIDVINSFDYDIVNYRNLETLNLQIYDKVIICGTSLQDNDYMNYLFDFNRLKNHGKGTEFQR